MNKKYIIAGVIIALVIVFFSGVFIYYKNHNLKKTIPIATGDLIIKNQNKSDIKITNTYGNNIEINLVGPADELKRVVFNKIDANTAEFSLPADSKGISGTIKVPQDIKMIDLDRPLYIPSGGSNSGSSSSSGSGSGGSSSSSSTSSGSSSGSGNTNSTTDKKTTGSVTTTPPATTTTPTTTTPPVTTNPSPTTTPPTTPPPVVVTPVCGNLKLESGEQCDDGNKVSGDGCSSACKSEIKKPVCGNKIIETVEECDDGNLIHGDGCTSTCKLEQYLYSACTIQIKQEERNTCCYQLNKDNSHPGCIGYWMFNYETRLCNWHCPKKDCGLGQTQAEKDKCCDYENKTKPKPLCIGNWLYGALTKTCEYECVNFSGNTKDVATQQITDTSAYCINTYTDKNNQSQCCDEFLKHPLHIGPRPGFPDCIGKWYLEKNSTKCAFKCVTREEEIEILKELKENIQNN